MNVVTLTIPTGASKDHHCALLNDLENHVLSRPAALDLRLGGEPLMAPSIAAAYCALIVRHLSEGGEVITSGVTALAGPAALVWLHGSIRRMNPGGYVLFTRGHTRESVEAEHSHAHGSRFFDGSDSGPEALCYERLLRRAGTHVDLGEVLDQPLFEPRLRELLLVGPVACPERARTRSPSSNLRAPDHGIWGEPEPPASHLSQ